MTAFEAGDRFPKGVHFWYALLATLTTAAHRLKLYARSSQLGSLHRKTKILSHRAAFLIHTTLAERCGNEDNHLPGYIEHLNEIKGEGVDNLLVIAMNEGWVMSPWGKANDIKNDKVVGL